MKACATVTQRPANKRVNVLMGSAATNDHEYAPHHVVATLPSALRIPHVHYDPKNTLRLKRSTDLSPEHLRLVPEIILTSTLFQQ
jgi:hypothetical protein